MPSRPISPTGFASCPSTRSSASSRPRSFCWRVPRRTSGASRSSPRRFSRWGSRGARPRPRPRSRYCLSPVVSAPVEPKLPDEIPGIVTATAAGGVVGRPARRRSSSGRARRRHPPPGADAAGAQVQVEQARPEHAAERGQAPGRPRSRNRSRPSSARDLHRRLARAGSALQDDLHVLRELTAVLPAVGPLAIEVRVVDGVTLLTATSPAVDLARWPSVPPRLLPLFRPGRAPWPVDQITLRGPRAVLYPHPAGAPAGWRSRARRFGPTGRRPRLARAPLPPGGRRARRPCGRPARRRRRIGRRARRARLA